MRAKVCFWIQAQVAHFRGGVAILLSPQELMLMDGTQECLFLSNVLYGNTRPRLFISLHRRLLSQLPHPDPLLFALIPLLSLLLHLHYLILQMLSLLDELFLGGL